ncbi:hypothetical protein GPA19_07625 [Azoarcus indigens]|uniref:hypothetical protein n=1 Tax=Azoarcus indigens TaxID=29545 RepID=UPI00105F5E43|nr:hypothetical protein [Azoarcus indigens]NMG64815.1 hypothetical protein [Azoarcus indigens]
MAVQYKHMQSVSLTAARGEGAHCALAGEAAAIMPWRATVEAPANRVGYQDASTFARLFC